MACRTRLSSLHPDAAGRRLGEESKHLASAQLTRHRRRALTLDRMHLKKVRRQVDPNPDKGLHGRLPYPRPAIGHAVALDAVRVRPSTSSLRPVRRRGAGGQHRARPTTARRGRECAPAFRRGRQSGRRRLACAALPLLRRPDDHRRDVRRAAPLALAVAEPDQDRHLMTVAAHPASHRRSPSPPAARRNTSATPARGRQVLLRPRPTPRSRASSPSKTPTIVRFR